MNSNAAPAKESCWQAWLRLT